MRPCNQSEFSGWASSARSGPAATTPRGSCLAPGIAHPSHTAHAGRAPRSKSWLHPTSPILSSPIPRGVGGARHHLACAGKGQSRCPIQHYLFEERGGLRGASSRQRGGLCGIALHRQQTSRRIWHGRVLHGRRNSGTGTRSSPSSPMYPRHGSACPRVGQAAALKLAMNLNIAGQMQALAESLTLARQAGIGDDFYFQVWPRTSPTRGCRASRRPS